MTLPARTVKFMSVSSIPLSYGAYLVHAVDWLGRLWEGRNTLSPGVFAWTLVKSPEVAEAPLDTPAG